jgi:hypothetical protein
MREQNGKETYYDQQQSPYYYDRYPSQPIFGQIPYGVYPMQPQPIYFQQQMQAHPYYQIPPNYVHSFPQQMMHQPERYGHPLQPITNNIYQPVQYPPRPIYIPPPVPITYLSPQPQQNIPS